MIRMFAQFFAMFTALFNAFEKFANATSNMAEWTEESSASFRDQARFDREQKLTILRAKSKLIVNQADTIAQKQLTDDANQAVVTKD